MPSELAIEARGLEKFYTSTPVLTGLELEVPAGSVYALLGPNGAGKTTAVRILATLTRADGGTAAVAGHDVATAPGAVRRAISLTGQYAALDALQTGGENLRMVGRLAGLSPAAARRRCDELLARFDLEPAGARRVSSYSGGMRRRLDLAASLTRPPQVLFLDEPTTGLDPRSRRELWRLVEGLRADGTTILLTTQYLEEADVLADRIAVLDGGRVVAEGTAAELKATVAGRRLDLTAVDRQAFAALASMLGEQVVHCDLDSLVLGVASDGSAQQVRAQLDDLDPAGRLVASFTTHTASLDDVFLTLTGRPAAADRNEPPHA
jgi:ABC-2 type transport system ATP-binding protein